MVRQIADERRVGIKSPLHHLKRQYRRDNGLREGGGVEEGPRVNRARLGAASLTTHIPCIATIGPCERGTGEEPLLHLSQSLNFGTGERGVPVGEETASRRRAGGQDEQFATREEECHT